MSVEIQLLLDCIRSTPAPGLDNVRSVDWNRLIDASIKHSIPSLLYGRVRQASNVPDEPRKRLEDLHYKNAARNVYLLAKTRAAVDMLDAAGLPVLPIKGAVLASMYYGDLGLRRFDDIDLLVARNTMQEARRVFLHHGYKPHLPLTPTQEHYTVQSGWEFIFTSDDEHSVEVSPGIAPDYFSFELPFEELWQQRTTMEIDGQAISIPSPEHHLLLLAAHGTKHMWSRLVWIADVIRLLEMEKGIPWDNVIMLARRTGGLRMLRLACTLAQPYGTFHVPAELAPDRVAQALADRVLDRMHAECGDATWQEELPFHVKARENVGDKLKYLVRIALQPSYGDWMAVQLPRSLYVLYYVIRPVRLLRRALSHLFSRND